MRALPRSLRPQSGYSLVELMVALIVGSIAIAGAYAGYRVFADYADKLNLLAESDRNAVQIMDMIGRDVRMAGYKDFSSIYGAIASPLQITPGPNCCGGASRCDQVVSVYDMTPNRRLQVTYVPQPIQTARGTRCQLRKSQREWSGVAWQGGYVNEPMADWLDGLELTGNNPKPAGTFAGIFQTVDIRLNMRGSHLVGTAAQPIRKTYEGTIQVRNVALVP